MSEGIFGRLLDTIELNGELKEQAEKRKLDANEPKSLFVVFNADGIPLYTYLIEVNARESVRESQHYPTPYIYKEYVLKEQ